MQGIRTMLVATGVLGALVAAPYLAPGLSRFQLLTPLRPGEGLEIAPQAAQTARVGEVELPPVAAVEVEHLRVPENVPIPSATPRSSARALTERPPVSITGPDAALTTFFNSLSRVEAGHAELARVAVWGDSNVASDLVTAVLRRKLQAHFGDGGHGFVLLGRTSKNYFHNDVRQIAYSGWGASMMTTPLASDGLYGLGATTFRSIGPGAFAKIGTAESGSFGRTFSKLSVDYMEQPGGGVFEVIVDGESKSVVTTDAPDKRARVLTVEIADTAHVAELRARGRDARIFGVWLERAGPGVVVDALGVTNSKARYLLRTDETFMAEQIRLRDPELLVLNFGVNGAREGRTLWGGAERYASDFAEVLARFRKHHPEKSCLVVSPGDAAAAIGRHRMSYPLVGEIVAIQERVALAAGCAFWNMYMAMGGDGSMARWADRALGKDDLLHPSRAGATLLGTWLYQALMERYAAKLRTESR